MITILERIFINPDMDDNRKRGIYGTLCGVVGIFLNLLLFIGKFLAGVLMRLQVIILRTDFLKVRGSMV